ncbi:MAG TPA: biopolymer transporter ExbD [Polyangiales bacterium]|nr:biopolymer transporter ExbD [Polyangiales bacterium]
MAFSSGSENKLRAEINVTPLVDVVLVMLIIFMVITPMLTRGREVDLPVASVPDAAHENIDAIVLTVTADKQLWLENSKVRLDKLTEEVKARWLNHPDQAVLIKADSSVTVKHLRPVFQKLKEAKISQIAFAVLEKK